MDLASVFVVGRLTKDPQFFGEDKQQRAVFSVAVNRGRDENRKVSFFDCIAWGKRANVMQNFSKGSGIALTGDLEQDSYENKEGTKVNRVQVNVFTVTPTTTLRSNASNENVNQEETANIPF